MASEKAIATALATFAESYPNGKEITKRTLDVWRSVLETTSDEQLSRAVMRIVRDPERRFFPSTGEVFAAIAEDAKPVDHLTVIHRIEQLGYYDPKRGWVYPTVEMIREKLGNEVADAYAVAGGLRIFADEAKDGTTTTRDIARRKLEDRLNEIQRECPTLQLLPPATLMLPAAGEAWPERKPLQLNPGQKTPLSETVAKVTDGVSLEDREEAA